MNSSFSHQKTTLTICACGQLHFTYGPITVRFEAAQFLAFAASVAMLVSQFQKSVGMPQATGASNAHGDVCH